MKTPFRILAATVSLCLLMPMSNSWAAFQQATDAEPATEVNEAEQLQQIPHTLKALEEAKAGKYGKLKRDSRQQLEVAEREIQALMQRNPDLSTLDAAERVRLFNAQEAVIGVVTGLKRSQLVCTYTQDTGTRFKTKHCTTRDMAEAAKRAAREATGTAQRDHCVPGQGNPCG